MLVLGAKEPGAHHPGSAEPVAHAAPAGHSMQSSWEVITRATVVFWWRPAGQGSGETAPSAQYEPAVQSSHAVLPGPSWNLPASHWTHEACPVAGCTVPGLHCLYASEPVEQEEPAGQAVH